MKLRKIVAAMETLLSSDARDRRRQADELRELLERMRKKERKLKRKLATASQRSTIADLEAKLEVARAQRRKGVVALKALRKR